MALTPIYRSQLSRPLSCAEIDSNIDACLARANHTGTQLASTISDFTTAVGQVALIQSLQQCCTTLTNQVQQLQNDIFGSGELNSILNTYTQNLQNSINTLSTNLSQLQTSLASTNSTVSTLSQNYQALNTFAQTLNSRLNLLKNPLATIYVDSVNGSDANSGITPTTAFQTLDKAAEYVGTRVTATNGIEVKLAPGTYQGTYFIGRIDGQSNRAYRSYDQKRSHVLYITGDVDAPQTVIINHTFYDSSTGLLPVPQLKSAIGIGVLNQTASIQGMTFQFNSALIPVGNYVRDCHSIYVGEYSWAYVHKCIFKPIPNTSSAWGHTTYDALPSGQYTSAGIATVGSHISANRSILIVKEITVDGNNANGFSSTYLISAAYHSIIELDDAVINLLGSPRFWFVFAVGHYCSMGVVWRWALSRFNLRFTGDFGARTGQLTLHGSQGGTSLSIPAGEVNRTFNLNPCFSTLLFPLEDSTYVIWPGAAANVTKTPLWVLQQSGNITNGSYCWSDTRPTGTTPNTVVNV